MDDYASKGSTVHPVKKYHRNMEAVAFGSGPPEQEDQLALVDASTIDVKNDDFWDYDRQVDLEAFSSRTLYDTLSKQSRGVTQTISKHKDEMKQMYNRIANENESLKGLWAAKMNLKGKAALATDEDLSAYERTLHMLELELERRKGVGHSFEKILLNQKQLMDGDELCRERHQVSFQASLREAVRTLKEYSVQLQHGSREEEFNYDAHRQVNTRVEVLLQKMSDENREECHRIGAWGVLGQGTGGQLLRPGKNSPMKRTELIGSDMSVKATDMVSKDSTGLLRPKPGSKMLLGDSSIVEVPEDYFVHPQTGHVLPIQGNVAYDPVTSRLVFIVDAATGEAAKTEDHFLPFVPFPIHRKSGQEVRTTLKPMEHKSDIKYGAPMFDPVTGLHVPIMALTIHPKTGALLPIGGTHVDPVTGLHIPIEVGSLMVDSITGQPVPILAVSLDTETGEVVPVGGTKPGNRESIPIIPGDSFVESLSGKLVRIHGGYLKDTAVLPSAGGFQALLDSSVMACEARVNDAVRQLKEALMASSGESVNTRHEESTLDAAVKELEKARSRMKSHLLRCQHDVERRLDRASVLSATGGCPGMYEFSKTGQLLPILVGTTMQDPSGSEQEVPILGAEKDRKTSNIVPVGGTFEDPEGGGLVAISIGRKAVDPITGEISPIIGARLNPENGLAIPITLSTGGQRKRKPPPGALASLEEELVARRSFWRRQRQREQELTTKEHLLTQQLLFDMDTVTSKTIERFLEEIDSGTNQLMEDEKREVQRRGGAEQEYASILPPEVIAVLIQGDAMEHEREELHVAAHVKLADILRRFFNKLQKEEKQYKDRIGDLDGAMNPDAENTTLQRYRQAKLRLQAELQEHLRSKMEGLDNAHSALEYARERSVMCACEAKIVLVRAELIAGDYDCQLSGVYGDADSQGGSDSELIPLLKQLIAMLESGGPFTLSSELLNLINMGQAAGGQHNVTNLNITGAGQGGQGQMGKGQGQMGQGQGQMGQGKGGAGQGGQKVVKEMHVKSSGDTGGMPDQAGILDKGRLNMDRKQQQDAQEKARALFEKQAYEAAKLENDLVKDEIDNINKTVDEYEHKKTNATNDAIAQLERRLRKAKTEKDREKLLMEHAEDIQRLNEAFEKQKLKQLKELRKRLMDERRQKKKDLHRKHLSEAENSGLPPNSVPDINMLSYDELKQELLRLQKQQESMWADMKKQGYEAADAEQSSDIDPDFERQINAMDLSESQKNELKNTASQRNHDLQKQINEMKEKLRNRKDRQKTSVPADHAEDLEGLTEEEKRHLLETRTTQADADRLMEDEATLKALEAAEREQRRRNEEQAMNEMLRNMKESERDRILQQYQDHLDQLNSRNDDRRQSAMDKVNAKLAARKRMKEELDKEKAVTQELDHITKTHAAQGDSDTAELIKNINEKVNGDRMTADQQKLLDKQLKEQEEIEARQREAMLKEKREIEDELHTDKQQVNEQMQQQKQLALAAHQNKFDRDVMLHHKNLSEAEYDKLLTAHKKEMEALEHGLEQEKERQKRELDERIAKRKKLREEQLKQKNQIEMEHELSRQQQERDKLKEKIAKDIENSALVENVKGGRLKNKNSEEAENMIYSVLRQRHLKEAIHLEDQLARELEAARKKARQEVEEMRQREREKLMLAFEQEMQDLIANAGDMSPEELTRRKEQLKKQQEKALKDFDNLTVQLATEAEKNINPHQEIQQTHARLELKEKHLQEMADAMKKYSPSEELYKKYQEEARLAAEEARHYKEDILRRMKEELERRKAEEKKREEERKRLLMEKYRQMEKDLELEHQREIEKQREREAEKARLRKQQLEERDRKQRDEIKKSNVGEDEKARLLREHQENMLRLNNTMQQEQEKSRSELNSKLEARRKRRLNGEKAKLSKQDQLDADQERKDALAQREKEGALQSRLPSSGDRSGGQFGLSTSGPAGAGSGGSSLITPTGNAEQDWVNMLMASPLFKQLNDLADMLEKNSEGAGPLDKVLGGDYSKPYIDVKDAQWSAKGDLSPVDINHITPSQFVVYRFGVFVIRLLHQSIGTPEVSLLLASNLPTNNYDRNAFRNSVHFEHARKILFVRKERMDSIGEFVVVILHSLAHIKSGDMTDDGNTVFLREFYKALRVVCQDMFFSRSQATPVAHSILGAPAVNTRTALEQALGSTKNSDEKVDVVNALVDMRVDTPTKLEFSEQQMSQRIQGSESVASNARLRQYLASKGGVLASSDFVSARMAELKGIKSPTPSPKPSPHRRGKGAGVQMSTPRDILDTQLVDMETRNDAMNAELAETLKKVADLKQGIQDLEKDPSSSDRLGLAREQLMTALTKKDDLLRRISCMEADIAKKERELKSRRR